MGDGVRSTDDCFRLLRHFICSCLYVNYPRLLVFLRPSPSCPCYVTLKNTIYTYYMIKSKQQRRVELLPFIFLRSALSKFHLIFIQRIKVFGLYLFLWISRINLI